MIKTKLGIWQLIQWIENQNDTLDKKNKIRPYFMHKITILEFFLLCSIGVFFKYNCVLTKTK